MTLLQESTRSSEFASWLSHEQDAPLDDYNVELSDEDLEQVAGGLTRAWDTSLSSRMEQHNPTTNHPDSRR